MFNPCAPIGGTTCAASAIKATRSPDSRTAFCEIIGQTLRLDAKVIQRYALGCIYYATNNVSTTFTDLLLGPGVVFPWNNERAWLTNTDECTWSNVQCDDNTGFIRRMDFVSTV